MFLYSITGSILAHAVTEGDKQDLARRICIELKRFDWEAAADGAVVSFLNNRNILHQMVRLDRTTQLVDSGEFIIDGATVRYQLITSYLIVFSVVLLVPLIFLLVTQSLVGIAATIGFWLLSCVGSSLWLSFRVRRALQRAVAAPPPPSLSL
jgi:hypothetical protein